MARTGSRNMSNATLAFVATSSSPPASRPTLSDGSYIVDIVPAVMVHPAARRKSEMYDKVVGRFSEANVT